MPSIWHALVLEVPAAQADELAGRCAALSRGVEVQPLGSGRSRLRIYVDTVSGKPPSADEAAQMLSTAGLDRAADLRVEPVEDGRWVERYQAGLRPFAFGERFTIHPDGKVQPGGGGRCSLLLVPGRAFGTGEHPTTRLCGEALERLVVGGSRWIDVGCGSGVLSLVALHCGAGRVLALDNDPEAVEVAREVFAANGVTERMQVRAGSLDSAAPGEWDGIVANIHVSFFLGSAPAIASRLAGGGRVVASGFLVADLDEVSAALGAAGLREIERRQHAGWALLVARRES